MDQLEKQLEKITRELNLFRRVNFVQTVVVICCLAFLIGKAFK